MRPPGSPRPTASSSPPGLPLCYGAGVRASLLLGACLFVACGDDTGATCVVGDTEFGVGELFRDPVLGVECTCSPGGDPGCKAYTPDGGAPDRGLAPAADGGGSDIDAAGRDSPAPDAGEAPPDAGAGASDRGGPEADAASAERDVALPEPDAGAECAEGPDCGHTEAVCARWTASLALREGVWEGSLAECAPGDMTPEWRADALERVNTFRWLAGLWELEDVEHLNGEAQACALALNARGSITHDLAADEPCYTAAAAHAASLSNIHSRPAVAAIADFVSDWGERNHDSLPHRIWLLSANIWRVGMGSTDRFSCLYVAPPGHAGGHEPPRWIAWPPPGLVPLDAVLADFTGWTLQSDSLTLRDARVAVTVDGAPRAVQQRRLSPVYGTREAIAFVPDGWQSEAGVTYRVVVEGALSGAQPVPIEYEVQVVDCD